MVIKTNVQAVEAVFSPGPTMKYIASIYGTLDKVVLEIVQNVLDARAANALVTVDMVKMRMSGYDDGKGTSRQEMTDQIGHIGVTIKDDDDIGEKAIGKFAPLGIADGKWVFISRPKLKDPKADFFRAELDKKLVHGKAGLPVEFADVPSFRFDEGNWTTCTSMSGLQRSALRGLLAQPDPAAYICDVISTAFSSRIKLIGTSIIVRIMNEKGIQEKKVPPQEFPGSHELVEVPTPKGPVIFEVYLTNTRQKNPQILVDHQGKLRFPLQNMADVWKSVVETLGCGFVQGVIREDFCTIAPGRETLEWDESLDVFIQAIEQIAEVNIKPWLKAIEDSRKDELLVEVGLEAIRSVENELLKDNPGLLSEVFKGAVSTGHVHSKDGEEINTTIRTVVKRHRKKREDEVPELPGSKRAKEKKVQHGGVATPTGSKRVALKGQSGLQIHYDHDGLANGYRIKLGTEGDEKGKVVINTGHRDWNETQGRKKAALLTYVKMLLTALMASALMPPPRNEIFMREFEDVFFQYRRVLEPMIR